MPTMAARRTRKTDTAIVETQEENTVTVTDDVYEPEATETETESATRGRKADPLNAAMNEFKSAKVALEKVTNAAELKSKLTAELEKLNSLPSVEDAQSRYDSAKAELAARM